MKTLIGVMILLLFLPVVLPVAADAESSPSFTVQGRIGEVSGKDRKIEIKGRPYYLPSRIIIKNEAGEWLAFKDLKPGRMVRMTGQMVTIEGHNMVKYTKIILLPTNRQAN